MHLNPVVQHPALFDSAPLRKILGHPSQIELDFVGRSEKGKEPAYSPLNAASSSDSVGFSSYRAPSPGPGLRIENLSEEMLTDRAPQTPYGAALENDQVNAELKKSITRQARKLSKGQSVGNPIIAVLHEDPLKATHEPIAFLKLSKRSRLLSSSSRLKAWYSPTYLRDPQMLAALLHKTIQIFDDHLQASGSAAIEIHSFPSSHMMRVLVPNMDDILSGKSTIPETIHPLNKHQRDSLAHYVESWKSFAESNRESERLKEDVQKSKSKHDDLAKQLASAMSEVSSSGDAHVRDTQTQIDDAKKTMNEVQEKFSEAQRMLDKKRLALRTADIKMDLIYTT